MANNARDIRNAAHNIERHAQASAQSAAQSARSNATTARAAQSAAHGAWAGAGFQAVTAFQAARAARAQEEQTALQYAMAEQEQLHQFAMWRQTADGVAFVEWREKATRLGQFLRNRDSEWLQAWAQAIGRAQAETSEAERQRFFKYPAQVKQTGLLIVSIVAFAAAGLAGLLAAIGAIAAGASARVSSPSDFTYEDCLAELAKPDNFLISESNCEAIKPETGVSGAVIWLVLLLVAAVGSLIWRSRRRQTVLLNSDVPNEARARVERWGFDPLTVQPGYAGFTWHQDPNAGRYADDLMALALEGHRRFPAQSQLIRLSIPEPWAPQANQLEEVRSALERFQQASPSV